MMTEDQSKVKRPKITVSRLARDADGIHKTAILRCNQKGWGVFLSRHEVQGVITEEYNELIEAVHSGDLEKVEDELIDLAVACLIGISSIESNGMQW